MFFRFNENIIDNLYIYFFCLIRDYENIFKDNKSFCEGFAKTRLSSKKKEGLIKGYNKLFERSTCNMCSKFVLIFAVL